MTTEKKKRTACQWFHELRDTNVCLISGDDIEDATKVKYCTATWRECELYQKERRHEPLLKELAD